MRTKYLFYYCFIGLFVCLLSASSFAQSLPKLPTGKKATKQTEQVKKSDKIDKTDKADKTDKVDKSDKDSTKDKGTSDKSLSDEDSTNESDSEESSSVIPESLTTDDIAQSVGSAVNKFGSSIKFIIQSNSLWDFIYFIIALLVGILLFIPFVKYLLSRLIKHSRSNNKWYLYTMIVEDVKNPLNLFCIALSINISQRFFINLGDLSVFFDKFYVLLYCLAFFWAVYNLVNVIEALILIASDKTGSREENKSGAIFARKGIRVFVAVFAFMFILDAVFSQNMGTWLAGLGIVGLALSLAAQDTLKNFIGSVMVLFDRPFKVGDRIVIANYDGVVQEMGFRSTRIKLLDGDIAFIPNSTLVNSEIDNITRREYIGKTINLSLVYETAPEKLEQAISILNSLVSEEWIYPKLHFKLQSDEYKPRIYFSEFMDSSLNIRISLWYKGNDYWQFMQDMNTLNFKILSEFNKAQLSFAYPTSTLYVQKS